MIWRERQAAREGVELYRVFSNATLEEILRRLPQTKEELLEIRGIAEKKIQKYGKSILEITSENASNSTYSFGLFSEVSRFASEGLGVDGACNKQDGKQQSPEESVFTVDEYLSAVNVTLSNLSAKIEGEISSCDIREKYIFFSLKDEQIGSVMPCFMWRSDYDLSGVHLEEGREVRVSGFSEIYKPSGRFTFRAKTLEYVGEGALKKAYEDLKRKLESEGLFALDRKKPLPEFPQKIGVITSREGAVIHDFLNNLGRYGFTIVFGASRVEGVAAVSDLKKRLQEFRLLDVDVLVVIRGGGSLESLQAFNNEALVREVSELPFPVVCAIGHHEDEPLMCMTADVAPSTPTAAARLLSEGWEHAYAKIESFSTGILGGFSDILRRSDHALGDSHRALMDQYRVITERPKELERSFLRIIKSFPTLVERTYESISESRQLISRRFCLKLTGFEKKIESVELSIKRSDPNTLLRRGYSIAYYNRCVLRSKEDVRIGDAINIQLADGVVNTTVKGTQNSNSL